MFQEQESNLFLFVLGGQTAAIAVPKGEGTEEEEEYDYAYYDETKLDSPFVNPHDPTHQSPELLAGNLAGKLAQKIRRGSCPEKWPGRLAQKIGPKCGIFPRLNS